MRPACRPTRPRSAPVALLAGLALLALMVVAGPAGAQASGDLSQISPGLSIVDASVSGTGPEAGRTLDSGQATAFLQAWLPNAIFGTPDFQNPPASLPVYDVEVDYSYAQGGGADPIPGFITVKYASDGTNAWVALPAQELWPGAVVTADQGDKWMLAPDGTVAAFHGQVAPDTVPAPEQASPVITSRSSSSSPSPVVVIIVAVVAVAAVVALVVLGLGRRRSSEPVDDGRR